MNGRNVFLSIQSSKSIKGKFEISLSIRLIWRVLYNLENNFPKKGL